MERYIIEVVLFQGFFLLVYQLLLKKETFFTYNRAYLLLTPALALVLPFIQIEALKPTVVTQEFFTQLPTIFIGEPLSIEASTHVQDSHGFTINWLFIYLIGIGLSLLIWIKKYLKINRFYRFQSKEKSVPRIIQIPNSDVAFSFLQTIFIGENLDSISRKQILSHEYIHVQQRHTWDLLLFEVLRVIFWFNPLIIQFQKNIAVVHEYIADAAVVGDAQDTRKKAYYNELLNTTFGTTRLSFTNTFFNHSLIKKRIIMLQKSRSKQVAKIKYLSILPLILGMLIYVSCVQDEGVQPTNTIVESSNLTGDLPPPPPPPPLPPVPVSSEWNAQKTWTEVVLPGDIPLAVVDRVPTFPGCDPELSNEERKSCLSQNISKHITRTFNLKIGEDQGLTGINRIFLSFKIDKQGNVVNIRSRAQTPELEEEARRVLNSLPQMMPGEHDGQHVGVLYSLPITFKIE